MAGATVIVTDTQRGVTRTLTADDAGQYNAPNLTPGTYTVRAEYKGFQAIERQNILIQVGTRFGSTSLCNQANRRRPSPSPKKSRWFKPPTPSLGGALSNELISDLAAQRPQFYAPA